MQAIQDTQDNKCAEVGIALFSGTVGAILGAYNYHSIPTQTTDHAQAIGFAVLASAAIAVNTAVCTLGVLYSASKLHQATQFMQITPSSRRAKFMLATGAMMLAGSITQMAAFPVKELPAAQNKILNVERASSATNYPSF